MSTDVNKSDDVIFPSPEFRQLRVNGIIQVQVRKDDTWVNIYGEFHPSSISLATLCHNLRSKGYWDGD